MGALPQQAMSEDNPINAPIWVYSQNKLYLMVNINAPIWSELPLQAISMVNTDTSMRGGAGVFDGLGISDGKQ